MSRKVIVTQETRNNLLDIAKAKKVYAEGNILKVIAAPEGDTEFQAYLDECIKRDKDNARRRLKVTKQVQAQNKELKAAEAKNSKLMAELQTALEDACQAREEAERLKDVAYEDLDRLQKKTQFELIGKIVRVALGVIISVGFVVSGMFVTLLLTDHESSIVESTWSNLMGILLTNSFSIVGTIMGVKYATEK